MSRAVSKGADLPVMKLKLIIAVLLGALGNVPSNLLSAEQFQFHHENIIGTSLDLSIQTQGQSAATKAEHFVLSEIERLARIFSSYSGTSELNRWQATQDKATPVSAELFYVFQRADHWRELSNGAFSPATGELTALWKGASKIDQLPRSEAILQAAKKSRLTHWKLDAMRSTAKHISNARINLDSIAKGYIIDQTGLALMDQFPTITSCLINIGGDLRSFGHRGTVAAITDPFSGSSNDPIELLTLPSGAALATSGNYQRGFTIKGKRYSHLLDPRNGYPVSQTVSSTVIAPNAADADALATTFSVLSPAESLDLANRLVGVECFLVSKDGTRLESDGWQDYRRNQFSAKGSKGTRKSARQFEVSTSQDWITNFDCIIALELNRITDRRYRRPYVAIWISDEDNLPIRTLSLWIQKEKWLPDLKQWYRNDKLRLLYDDTDIVSTISSATRPAGRYRVKWDGNDDSGQAIKAGQYFVNIEVTREHGTYQKIREEIVFPSQASKTKLGSNTEVKEASIEFRRKKTI